MSLPPRWAPRLALLGLLGSLVGCGCGSPVTLGSSAAAPAASSSADAVASAAPAAPAAPASPEPLLADPRLAAASQLVAAQDFAGAALAIERLLVEAPPDASDRPRWLYQAGRLQAQARRPAEALRLFAASAETPWALSSYAALAAAQQAIAAGRADDALRWARAVAADTPIAPAARMAEAEAFERKGTPADAIPLWRRYLEGLPANRPPRWADASVKLASALLVPGAEAAAVEEALGLARRVAVELPTSPQAPAAQSLEYAALAALPPERRAALARRPEDTLTRASALLDAGKVTDAEAALAEAEAAAPAAARSADVACKISSLDGKLKTRRKQREHAADAWGEAIKRCTGEARVTALFRGGDASASAGRNTDAMARYETLEREAPRHRLADDARLKGALAALSLGDEARFSSMLERIDEAYPEGDLTTEGLFRLALHRMGKGDWAASVAPLEASRKLRPRERDYWAAGRSDYFLARALAATGDRPRALALYRSVIAEQPLSYYMALAHARLAEADPAQAAEALKLASDSPAPASASPVASASAPPPPSPPALVPSQAASAAPLLPSPGPSWAELPPPRAAAAARAVELLHQGEFELARAEFVAAQLSGQGASAEAQWTVASLYARAGADVLAHAIPRGKLSDWLEHYPSGPWRSRWELAYPRPYLDAVQREARRSGIPQALTYAVMREESVFDPAATSAAPAYGLMQFTLDTGKSVGKKLGLPPINEAALKTPSTSIALGSRYLADLRSRYPDCPALAIPSYNAGPGATRRWLAQRPSEELDLFVERIPYEETRNYTKRVLKSYAAYLFLYEPQLLPEVLRLPLRAQSAAAAAAPPEEAAQ